MDDYIKRSDALEWVAAIANTMQQMIVKIADWTGLRKFPPPMCGLWYTAGIASTAHILQNREKQAALLLKHQTGNANARVLTRMMDITAGFQQMIFSVLTANGGRRSHDNLCPR